MGGAADGLPPTRPDANQQKKAVVGVFDLDGSHQQKNKGMAQRLNRDFPSMLDSKPALKTKENPVTRRPGSKTCLQRLVAVCSLSLPIIAATGVSLAEAGTSVFIRNVQIHAVVGGELSVGSVLVEEGIITALGPEIEAPEGIPVFDGKGGQLFPGFIDGHTTLGLVEIPTVKGSVDTRETGRINPDVKTELAVNPGSHLIPVARRGGVTTVMVVPGGQFVTGTAAVMNLDGWTWEEMLVKSGAGVRVIFPKMATIPSQGPHQEGLFPKNNLRGGKEETKVAPAKKKKEKEKLRRLNELFDAAKNYRQAKKAAKKDSKIQPPPEDRRLEALLPVLNGQMPLIITAQDVPTIKAAIAWTEERQLTMVLDGARDSWRMAPELAEKKIPVLLPSVLSVPVREDEPYDTSYTMAKKLHEAGVLFCFTTGSASSVRNLFHHAAMSVAFGLPYKAALEALTINAAKIFGVADRLGSIEVGKDANLILTDGDPLEVRSHVTALWIQGRRAELETKQERLYRKYRSRPRPGSSKAQSR